MLSLVSLLVAGLGVVLAQDTSGSSGSGGAASTGSGGGGGSSSKGPNKTRYLIAHAVLVSVAFLILLPLGALLPRYLRTVTPRWVRLHWWMQFGLAAPLIIAGVTLGYYGAKSHLNNTHKITGTVLLVLYFTQVLGGGVAHWLKPRRWRTYGAPRDRPLLNYIHPLLGLTIISLAFAQVRNGFRVEWPSPQRGSTPRGIETAWIVWIVVWPLLYIAGFVLLPRQLRAQREHATAVRAAEGRAAGSDSPSMRGRDSIAPLTDAHQAPAYA